MLRRISTISGKKNEKPINKQINNIQTFFKNHFHMDSDMVLDKNTYFEISTQISKVEYVCYTPSKEYIRTKTDIPGIYELFQEQVNNIKSSFPNDNISSDEYDSLYDFPDVENTIVLLYNEPESFHFRWKKGRYVFFYYDDIMFNTDYITNKKILMHKEIDNTGKNHIYLNIKFQKPKTVTSESSRSIINTEERDESKLFSARSSILYNMFETKQKNFENIENDTADSIIKEIQYKLENNNRNIYLFFFQDLGKEPESQINNEFLKICKTFNSVERIKIIYCPLIGLTDPRYNRFVSNYYHLPYSKTNYENKNMSEAISHIDEQIMIKMKTTEKNTSFISSSLSTISAMIKYSKQTKIIKNIFVAPFFYSYLSSISTYHLFANSMVQLRSYLPCIQSYIEINYILSDIQTSQVYKIFLLKYKQELSTFCKLFYVSLLEVLGDNQKVKLGLEYMSDIINMMPNTIIDNLSYIIGDVENIALNYLNFGRQNVETSNRMDLYITVYKELGQDQNGL